MWLCIIIHYDNRSYEIPIQHFRLGQVPYHQISLYHSTKSFTSDGPWWKILQSVAVLVTDQAWQLIHSVYHPSLLVEAIQYDCFTHRLVGFCAFESNREKKPTSTEPNAIAVLLSFVSLDHKMTDNQTTPPAIKARAKLLGASTFILSKSQPSVSFIPRGESLPSYAFASGGTAMHFGSLLR